MLDSISSMRRCNLALVKFRSRLLTALNLLPSMATSGFGEQTQAAGTSTTNCRQTLRIALPLSLRNLAIVLKSGISRPSQPHQFDVALALFLKAAAGLNAIEVAVNV